MDWKRLLRVITGACLAPLIIGASVAHAADTPGKNPKVKMDTSEGSIVIELFPDKAPATVENFLKYVNDGFYNGLIFHRVINGFMIQGGGMDANMQEKDTNDPVMNEADNGLGNDAYTIAMARTMDPHSATAQFFINVNDNAMLNHKEKSPQGWGYCVFGRVIEGQGVVDKIKEVSTGTKGFHENVPDEPVTITKAFEIAD